MTWFQMPTSAASFRLRWIASVVVALSMSLSTRSLPDFLVRQALLKPHVRRPHDVHVGLDEPARQLAEQGRRVGLVSEVEIPGIVLGLEAPDLLDDLVDLLGPITGRIALAVVAELAAAPVTAAGRQVWQNPVRDEILLQR